MALDHSSPLYSQLSNIITIVTALTLVTLVNCNYRIMISISRSTDARKRVTTYHALATEALQGILGLGAMTQSALCLKATIDEVLRYGSMPQMMEADGCMRVVLFFAYMFAVGLVDFIEAWVVLGQLPHPTEWQCFIITRNLFRRLVHFLWEPFARHLRRSRLSQDALIAPSNRYETLTDLEYLDLVHNLANINWNALERVLASTGAPRTVDLSRAAGHKGGPRAALSFPVAGVKSDPFGTPERTSSIRFGPLNRRCSCSW